MPPKQSNTNKRKKKTVEQQFDETLMQPTEEGMAAFVAFTMDAADEAEGFENVSRKTRRTRDRHFREFEKTFQIFRKYNNLPYENQSDDVFIKDTKHICRFIRFYFHFMAQKLKPRSRSDASLRFTTLYERRLGIVSGLLKNDRKTKYDLDMFEIRKAIAEGIWHAARLFNLRTKKFDIAKIFLTRSDLILLIFSEYQKAEATGTFVDNVHQHVIGWILAFILGLRPGSLARHPDAKPDECLLWENCRLCYLEDGTLAVRLEILHYKSMEYGVSHEGPLRFTITAAPDDDIVLSLPHRLLALALDRDLVDMEAVLKSIKKNHTDEELREYMQEHAEKPDSIKNLYLFIFSDLHNLPLKADALKQPVFLKRGPKGAPLETVEAMPSASFTYFLEKAAMSGGLPPRCSFYAWRRLCATLAALKKGDDVASEMLGHLNGNTFKKSYKEKRVNLDVSMIALCREERQRDELIEPLSLYRAGENDTLVEQLVLEDEEVQKAIEEGDPTDIKNAKRSARYHIRISLRLQSLETLKKYATNVSVKKSRKDLEEMSRQLNTSFKSSTEDDIADNDIGADGLAKEEEHMHASNTDDIKTGWAFTESLLLSSVSSNTKKTQKSKDAAAFCPLCQQDEGVSEAKRNKKWKPWELGRHMESAFHNATETTMRVLLEEKKNAADKKFTCPVTSCGKKYSVRKSFMRHIHDLSQSDDHLVAVGNQGWITTDGVKNTTRTARKAEAFLKWSGKDAVEDQNLAAIEEDIITTAFASNQIILNVNNIRLAAAKRQLLGGITTDSAAADDRSTLYQRYLNLIGEEAEDDEEEIEDDSEEEEEAATAATIGGDDDGDDMDLEEEDDDDAV